MLNIYEPLADSRLEQTNGNSAKRSSVAGNDDSAPSTEQQTFFLVENVYEVGDTCCVFGNHPAMAQMFRLH